MECMIIEQIDPNKMGYRANQKQQTPFGHIKRPKIPLDNPTAKQYNPH